MKCADCNNKNIVSENGFFVCRNCGLVVDEIVLHDNLPLNKELIEEVKIRPANPSRKIKYSKESRLFKNLERDYHFKPEVFSPFVELYLRNLPLNEASLKFITDSLKEKHKRVHLNNSLSDIFFLVGKFYPHITRLDLLKASYFENLGTIKISKGFRKIFYNTYQVNFKYWKKILNYLNRLEIPKEKQEIILNEILQHKIITYQDTLETSIKAILKCCPEIEGYKLIDALNKKYRNFIELLPEKEIEQVERIPQGWLTSSRVAKLKNCTVQNTRVFAKHQLLVRKNLMKKYKNKYIWHPEAIKIFLEG